MDQSQTLITFIEAMAEVRGAAMSGSDLAVPLLIQGSEEIEKILDRKIVSRGTITEFHSFGRPTPRLWLHQWPVLANPTIQIYEDDTRVYASTALLTLGTDYVVNYDSGEVTRVDGGAEIAWLTGFEAVKVVYAAGYTQASVPGDLKRVAAELFAMQWYEKTGRTQGQSTINDGLGSRSFFGPADITSRMMARLKRHARHSFGGVTYARSTVAA